MAPVSASTTEAEEARSGTPSRGPWIVRGRSDRRLAARAAEGDERAFEELVRRHAAALRGYCVQLLSGIEDAEDALQDSLASAHLALLERGPPDEPRAWLFTIARNRCLSVLRARPPEAAEFDDASGPASAGAGEVALSRAELRALVEDLGRLDPDVREALVLTRLSDLNHRQVAGILGCPPERVRSLVRQARIELAAARLARELSCGEIRAELAELRRGGFRRSHLRRHLADCEPCRVFRHRLAEQNRALGVLLPVPGAIALGSLHRGVESVGAGGILGGGGSTLGPGAAGGLGLGGAKLATTLVLAGSLAVGGAAITVDPPSSSGRQPASVDRAEPDVTGASLPGPSTIAAAPRRRGVAASPGPGAQQRGEPEADSAPAASVTTAEPEPDPSPSRAAATVETRRPEPDRDGSLTASPSRVRLETSEPSRDADDPLPPPAPESRGSGGRPDTRLVRADERVGGGSPIP